MTPKQQQRLEQVLRGRWSWLLKRLPWPGLLSAQCKVIEGISATLIEEHSKRQDSDAAFFGAKAQCENAKSDLQLAIIQTGKLKLERDEIATQRDHLGNRVDMLANDLLRSRLEIEKLKTQLERANIQCEQLSHSVQKEKDHHHETKATLVKAGCWIFHNQRLAAPAKNGIRSLFQAGKRVLPLLALLLPLSLLGQFAPYNRNPWSTNFPPRAVTGLDNLSVTNLGSGTNWEFFNIGPFTVARLMDVTNIASAFTGDAGGTNSRQGGTLLLTNLSNNSYTGYTNQVFGGTNISVRTVGGTNFIDTTGHLNNWSQIPTGEMANVVSTTFLTNWANSISNYVTAATNSASITNWINFRQPADALLSNLVSNPYTGYTNQVFGGTNISVRTLGGTNFIDTTGNLNDWSQIPTGAMANVVSTTFLTNWANAVSNYVTAATNSASVTNWINSRQPADAVLSNLVGTVANNVTNVVSLSTTNATSKPLTNAYATGVLTLFGVEAGNNITLTPNASNIVIASTASGGLTTNANQFGAAAELAIKSGALLTNVLFYPSNVTAPSAIFNAVTGMGTNLTEWRNTNGGVAAYVNSNLFVFASNLNAITSLAVSNVSGSANAVFDANKLLTNGALNVNLQFSGTTLSLTNLSSVQLTNQMYRVPEDFKSIVAFRTNQIDFTTQTLKAFTNGLATNIVCQLTNVTVGTSVSLFVYGGGILGGTVTNAWNVFCTASAGTTIYWPTGGTNGNLDVLINSNQIVEFVFEAPRSTNIIASYRAFE